VHTVDDESSVDVIYDNMVQWSGEILCVTIYLSLH